MTIINLRKYYPFCRHDVFVEVSDRLAAQFQQWERDENAFQRKKYWHQAHYSLDCDDGLEQHVLITVESPEIWYEKKLSRQQLRAALRRLPKKQGKRIYAHYILGFSKTEIACAEKVGKVAVGESIARGLRRLEIFLGKNFR